jgi:hypothetical protein
MDSFLSYKKKKDSYSFYNNCVGWDSSDMDGLTEVIDNAQEVTLKTFLQYVTMEKILELFPFYAKTKAQGLTLANDWAVRFFRSTYRGKKCYYIQHSAIEYVFLKD